MNNAEIQEHLLFITKRKVQTLHSENIRGVTAVWKNDTAYITFYFAKPPTEIEQEDASVICTEIVAHMPRGMLEDQYFTLEVSKPLPSDFLAYNREIKI